MHSLRQHIERIIKLTDEEFEKVLAYFRWRKYKKHQFVLQEGSICSVDSYVLSGALRQYYTDNEGKEHISQFAFEDWWISDWSSIMYQFLKTQRLPD